MELGFSLSFSTSLSGKKLLKEMSVSRLLIAKLGPKVFANPTVYEPVLGDIDFMEFIGGRVFTYPASMGSNAEVLLQQTLGNGVSLSLSDANTLITAITGTDENSADLKITLQDFVATSQALQNLLS